jgi:quercetin dioxygenase-like cupin family protein
MEEQHNHPKTVGPAEGKTLAVVGDTYRILISGAETNGAFASIEMLIPPGGGPGPHAHADFEESFYVIEGEIEVKSEFGNYTATEGSFVSIPKGGLVHCFKNISDKNARLLCTVVPAGLETFFEEVGEPVAPGEFLPPAEPDEAGLKRLQDIAQKHGQQLYPPNYLD